MIDTLTRQWQLHHNCELAAGHMEKKLADKVTKDYTKIGHNL